MSGVARKKRFFETLNKPASGSQEEYGGSRKVKQRYAYSQKSKAAFVELVPFFRPTAEDFKKLLEGVPGVQEVKWQSSKSSQNNIGGHYLDSNLLVRGSTGPTYMEFELTRNQHSDDPKMPFTVTAMFKDPPHGYIGEA